MSADFLRSGPRPLALHAFAAWRANMLALAAVGGAGDLAPPDTALRLQAATRRPDDAGRLALAVMAETGRRWGGFWEGVAKYRAHPYRRGTADRAVLHAIGDVRLFDFAPGGPAPPILVIPSLINSSDVLDLLPGRSLMQGLTDAGFRPFLVDWGAPGADAARWTIERYVAERLMPLTDVVVATTGRAPVLAGYCMGGLLATALAARRPWGVRGLALLAMPWDFHAPSAEPAHALAGMDEPFQRAAAATGAVPVDLLQTLFFTLDPTLAARKFRQFAAMDRMSEAATLFVAMEDWVNGGPPLAAPAARSVLADWYGRNDTRHGRWRVGGGIVDNGTYDGPTLIAAPTRDRIVPLESARAYGDGAPHARLLEVEGGHVGMIVGDGAKRGLWAPFVQWLGEIAT